MLRRHRVDDTEPSVPSYASLGGGHTERITRIEIDKQELEHNDKIQKFAVVEGLDEFSFL